MGGLNVKITMIERVLEIVAPHPCYGCGKVGTLLCHHCKYNIISEPFVGCILCQRPQIDGICDYHDSPLERAFVVSTRTDTLENAINGLKFSNVKACARVLAELLDASLPILPETITIVPIPTVRSHIRRRGYDQVELIARHFAALRGLQIVHAITRVGGATQHTANRATREVQANGAFASNGSIVDGTGPILLLDDIITTGSTLLAASRLLVETKRPIWVAALAYQPLD